MRATTKSFLFIFFTLVSVASHAQNSLPLQTFYEDPLLRDLTFSPDGKKILAIQHQDGIDRVMVHDLINKTTFYPMSSDNSEYSFNWLRWAENGKRVLASINYTIKRPGMISQQNRLLSLDAEKAAKPVNMYQSNRETQARYPGWTSQFQDNIICSTPTQPDYILVAVDRDTPLTKAVYKINVNSGHPRLVMRERSQTQNWFTDRDCNVRLMEQYDDDTRTRSYRYLDAEGKW